MLRYQTNGFLSATAAVLLTLPAPAAEMSQRQVLIETRIIEASGPEGVQAFGFEPSGGDWMTIINNAQAPGAFRGSGDSVSVGIQIAGDGIAAPTYQADVKGLLTAPATGLAGTGLVQVRVEVTEPLVYLNNSLAGQSVTIQATPVIEGGFGRPSTGDAGLAQFSVTIEAVTGNNGSTSSRSLASYSASFSEVGGITDFGASADDAVLSDSDGDGDDDAFFAQAGDFGAIIVDEGEIAQVTMIVSAIIDFDEYELPIDDSEWFAGFGDTVSLGLTGPAGGTFEAVPEPTSLALLAGASLCVVRRRRG